jgi:hypothetical protein
MNEVCRSHSYPFTFIDLPLLNIVSSLRHPPIYSTIYQRFQPRHLRNSVTSSIDTSALTPSKSRMSANGGMKGGWCIPAFIVWPWTTLQFQVCTLNRLDSKSLLIFPPWKLATSVDVERIFSQGRIVLFHLCSRLSVQSTRALMCFGVWSRLGYVKDSDIKAVVILPEVPAGTKEGGLAVGWDAILD